MGCYLVVGYYLYFDPRPKTLRSDLFGREKELDTLGSLLAKGSPLILILGLRRTGKTSLLKTALNETDCPSLVLDLRTLEELRGISRQGLIKIFVNSINEFLKERAGWRDAILEILRRVKGFKIAGLEVEIEKFERPEFSLSVFFNTLNAFAKKHRTRVIVALDEAQELERIPFLDFRKVLAHVYDYSDRVTVVLTGSKVGLLYRFLKLDDPKAPLCGRHVDLIEIGRLPEEEAREFMVEGFKQTGVSPNPELIGYALEKLDGVIGWLTSAGAKCLLECSKTSIDRVLEEEGKNLVLSEFGHFIQLRPTAAKLYLSVMRTLALEEKATWSTIKDRLELKFKKTIYNKNLATMLNNLRDTGFTEKMDGGYAITDPVIKHVFNTCTEGEISRSIKHLQSKK